MVVLLLKPKEYLFTGCEQEDLLFCPTTSWVWFLELFFEEPYEKSCQRDHFTFSRPLLTLQQTLKRAAKHNVPRLRSQWCVGAPDGFTLKESDLLVWHLPLATPACSGAEAVGYAPHFLPCVASEQMGDCCLAVGVPLGFVGLFYMFSCWPSQSESCSRGSFQGRCSNSGTAEYSVSVQTSADHSCLSHLVVVSGQSLPYLGQPLAPPALQ